MTVLRESVPLTAAPTRSRRRTRSGGVFAWALLLPTVVATAIISLYPLADTLWLSFHDTVLSGKQNGFVGLANFSRLLSDAYFRGAWGQTITFTVASTALETLFGLAFALVLHQKFPLRGLVRALVLIPWAIPTVAASKMFQRLFDGQVGVVNYVLERVGLIDSYVNFLGEGSTALATIVAADVWKTTPFMAILILAALQTIPDELRESAIVDGAGAFRRLTSIVLPMIAPAMLVAALIRALDAFRIFDLPYTLTGGGPAGSTETLSTYAYKQVFSGLQIGYGSAAITVTFITEVLIAGIFVAFLVRQSRRLG
ncbi:multiple sugar transport system permease protein [Kribbella aluminosa]|uniref:Multiple sugar transport system permease protein n=1 Tax=Kribbella aluminosa TaxID=416017 RepID=A0ABS4UJ78_9ACTN|nr:sugar ABC transporter permease [Kribbella aluminosa]MBP2351673.1 multiple sugar transport system permease protein [Kribbella aluminosa]